MLLWNVLIYLFVKLKYHYTTLALFDAVTDCREGFDTKFGVSFWYLSASCYFLSPRVAILSFSLHMISLGSWSYKNRANVVIRAVTTAERIVLVRPSQ